MEVTTKNRYLILGALLAIPVLFGIYVEWSYYHALSMESLPFFVLPGWLWFLIFFGSLSLGVILINLVKFRIIWTRLAVSIGYLLIMSISLFIIHFYIACFNGDCL